MAGTIAAGDYLKEQYPGSLITASEALQCPTLLNNGFGAHRIEGIGDKHVPWIHNVKNTDMVVAIDDAAAMGLMRLFNEETGQEYLHKQGISPDLIQQLPSLGISGIANVLSAIKMAKYYEMTELWDVLLTVATDSMEMYRSRVQELRTEEGDFTELDVAAAFHRYLLPRHNHRLYPGSHRYQGSKALSTTSNITPGWNNKGAPLRKSRPSGMMKRIGQAYAAAPPKLIASLRTSIIGLDCCRGETGD